MTAEREMTLAEWVGRLPEFHLAHRQYTEMRENTDKLAAEIVRLRGEAESMEQMARMQAARADAAEREVTHLRSIASAEAKGDAPQRCKECMHTTFERRHDGSHICVHCKSIAPQPAEAKTPAPAMPNGVEYDRELIAEMLEAAAQRNSYLFSVDAIRAQADLLRAADNRDAAGMDSDEDAYVIDRMGKLLAEIAVIVNGPEPAATRWSYHDLPDKVRALKATPAAVPAGEVLDRPARVGGRDFKAGELVQRVVGRAHAEYDRHHGGCLRHPYTGELRDYRDVESDPDGTLCVGHGPLSATIAPTEAKDPAPAMPNGVDGLDLIWLNRILLRVSTAASDVETQSKAREQAAAIRRARKSLRAADNRDATGVEGNGPDLYSGPHAPCIHPKRPPAAVPAGEAVAWRHPDEVPEVAPGGNAYFWVAVRRKHDGRVYSFPAQYLNAMLLCNEWSDDTERSGNRYHHGPTCEDEGSFPATGWHDEKEHGEYDGVYSPLLGDADELVAWREVANYSDTTPPAPVQAAHPAAGDKVRELVEKWRQRAEQKISASQHASIEQKCIARFRADDDLDRADELEAALQHRGDSQEVGRG